MSTALNPAWQGGARQPGWRMLVWLGGAALFLLLWSYGPSLAPWASVYPAAWQWPLARTVGGFTQWLVNEAALGPIRFTEVTRAVAAAVALPYDLALGLLASGLKQGQGSDAVQILPPLSWLAVTGLFAALGHYAGGWRLAVLEAACFLFIALFGHWHSAMVTLASIVIAVPIGIVLGLFLGLAAYRWPAFERAIAPFLDLMQTVPVFAYLVPILVLFGFGPVSAILATVIYAMPPMTRLVVLALKAVPAEITDLGRMVGCTRRQMTWRVMLPAAMPGLMVGVNQVIMLSLNMVIIASMIGAGGLGFDVLAALRRLDIGTGLEAGLAIVALAIALDRLSQAWALRPRDRPAPPGTPFWRRRPYLCGILAFVLLTGLLGALWSPLQTWPEAWQVTTGGFWESLVRWINVNFFDTLEAVKSAVVLNVLVPFKRLLLGLPWLGAAGLLTLAGLMLGGIRLCLVIAALCLFVAATGLWEKAMITVYLCGVSVLFAALLGIPLGILAVEYPKLWPPLRAVIDTLQTLPSFVYLMPAVMLFRVGDFTAMVAVVAYAVVPAIRYTVHGLQRIEPQLIEAGVASGSTRWQLLTKIRLKLALPEILLGVNQTIMLAISMLVITALVGTRDLGQEVYIALTKADVGRGIVAGLGVAAIAIIADRLVSAGAGRLRARLGLSHR